MVFPWCYVVVHFHWDQANKMSWWNVNTKPLPSWVNVYDWGLTVQGGGKMCS